MSEISVTFAGQVPPHSVLRTMHEDHGHFTAEWDPNDEASTKNAANLFADLKKEGFLFFKTDAAGKAVEVKKFDPTLGSLSVQRLVATPPFAGG